MKEAIQLKDFLEHKYISNVAYAPDGNHVAYVIHECDELHNEYRSSLYVWDKGKHRRLTTTGKEQMFFWQDNETIIFANLRDKDDIAKVSDGEELSVFYAISIHGGEAQEAFRIPLQVTSMKQVSKGMYMFSASYNLLYSYRYMLEKDAYKQVMQEQKDMEDYEVLDELPFYENGRGYCNKVRNSLFSYDASEKKIKRVSEELLDVYGYEIKNQQVYYFGESFRSVKTNKESIYRYDMVSDKSVTVLEKGNYSVGDIQPWGNDVLVVASENKHYGINENPYFYILDEAKKEFVLLAENEDSVGSSVGSDARYGGGSWKAIKDDTCYFITTRNFNSQIYAIHKNGQIEAVLEMKGSVDEIAISDSTLCFVGMGQGKLQELYTYDLVNKKTTQQSFYNETMLENKDVRPFEACNFEQDGQTLYGWVMKPRDFDETKRYPAILDIHGGPKTVYGEVYYHEMQVWANLGYFVFFMNPRGGDGRGNEFADIRGKYGTIDYDDLMKFTDVVLENYPSIDASKVGVTGGSYGGFMTNWIITHTNRFACGASQRSIANWVSFAFTSDINEFFANDQQDADTFENVAEMWWHSPLKYADQCTTPTLFIHSNEDYRCPYSEGLQMYSALKSRGVESRLVMFKKENHELSRSGKPKHRVKRLEEITTWMERHLKA